MTTKTLDHIVHRTPPGTVEKTAQQFRELGFNVINGGVHTDRLTANSLVILGDHAYLELISFTKPVEAYPPSSPSRRQREIHNWASRASGWIDYAFLGNGSSNPPHRISDIVNGRAESPLYLEETPGGRTRPDGETLRWIITTPVKATSILPFFCGDVTDRHLRVPTEPNDNTQHPSRALGVAHIVLLISESKFAAASKELSVMVVVDIEWRTPPTLILSMPSDQEQARFVSNNTGLGIYEVGFWVGETGKKGSVNTPFGRIVWVEN
ncbi:glyoxalase-like domain-containing protein [Mycena rebaudengoi]|nr:glyoxalase-like domain-containing protein [Mycena rebaudengoi]